MALLNGKTPDELAKEIITSVVEDQAVLITGTAMEELEFLVKYKNAPTIHARGEKWYAHEKDNWTKVYLTDMIHSLAKAKKEYLANKDIQEQDNLFRLLRARGIGPVEAEKMAYPNGIPVSNKK